jgi:hypothetical protein
MEEPPLSKYDLQMVSLGWMKRARVSLGEPRGGLSLLTEEEPEGKESTPTRLPEWIYPSLRSVI